MFLDPPPSDMKKRRPIGNFIAEHVAVIVFILLFMTFPVINLATSTYRYNMLCGAAKAAAHAGANSQTFSGNIPASQVAPNTWAGVALSVPAVIQNYLGSAMGISNVHSQFRIVQANINTQAVTYNPWGSALPTTADTTNYIYSIQVEVDADVWPLYPMNVGFLPTIPGLTGPAHQSSSAQEMCEYASGLNQ